MIHALIEMPYDFSLEKSRLKTEVARRELSERKAREPLGYRRIEIDRD